jgi:signal transduction histidine kinase
LPENAEPNHDFRVLVYAPIGKDARLICEMLQKVEIEAEICVSISGICEKMQSGAGALMIGEEGFTPHTIEALSTLISQQPSWSDFPLVLLTVAGSVSAYSQRRRELREPLGNVLLLERPVRPETLISTVQSALRARRRQYQIRDQIEQFRKAQDALRQAEKLAVAGRLAASIAHEINNPLEAVTNLLYLIRHSESMTEVQSYLGTAEQELSRVTEIVTQTLKFYRQHSQPAYLNVNEVLESLLLLFQPRFSGANITVRKEFEDVGPVMGLGGELRQVFANLMTNALDAMRDGGTLTIRVRRAKELTNGLRPGVRVSIADTGSGIPPEIRSRIFEPFVSTKDSTGTGLGLWVSSEIIQKHSGRIRLKSRVSPPSSGTVFSVFIPAESPASSSHAA